MKFGKIGLVLDSLGWVKTWCGLILVWDNGGVGYFRLGYVLVWVDFRLGSFCCGICRKWFGVGYVAVWVMLVWDKSRHRCLWHLQPRPQ